MIKTFLVISLALLVQAGSAAFADEFFRWTDENGTLHFTNNPSKIPPDYRTLAEVLSIPDQPRVKPIAPLGLIPPSPNRDLNGHDERWWKEQLRRWQLQREERTLKLMEAERKLGQLQFRNEVGPFRAAETARLLRDVEKYKQEVRQTEEIIGKVLPDEARKAGAPPGWLR